MDISLRCAILDILASPELDKKTASEDTLELAEFLRECVEGTGMNRFKKALAIWDTDNPKEQSTDFASYHLVSRALFAVWWFVENIDEECRDRQDVFFNVRELVREAEASKS